MDHDEWIARQNIKNFSKLISQSSDFAFQKVVNRLLRKEREKIPSFLASRTLL
jgi:hypothetical protein